MIKKRLGDIVNFKRGYDLPSYKRVDGKFPVISSSGVSGYHSEFKADGEGLITGRYGTLGEVYYVNGKYWPHNTALYVTDFKGNYPKYVYFLLKQLGNLKTSDKSTVPGVNRNDLHEIMIPYIEPDLQKPIADCLFQLEEKIKINDQASSAIESIAKTLYDYWFVQFDFPDEDGKPYRSSGGNMVYNEALRRNIPFGWEVKSLYDIATYTNGIACQKYRPRDNDEKLRVIKIREMSVGFSDNTEYVSLKVPKAALIDNGDVLFSWSASLEVVLWSRGKGVLNQHIFKVTSSLYPKSYYYHQLLDYLRHFKMLAENRKTTMGHITKDHLVQARIAVAPTTLVKKFDQIVMPLLEYKVRLTEENQKLMDLRSWLLPMLMNGQLMINTKSGRYLNASLVCKYEDASIFAVEV